jgi:hypothetical protein
VKPQSKAEAAVLILISAGAVAIMVPELIHKVTIDKWLIIVFGIAALPWFWRTLESITFPGGGLKMLQARQDRQESEIEVLKFLVVNFIPEPQRRVLGRLADADAGPYEFGDGSDSDKSEILNALNGLGGAGLVERIFDRPAGQLDIRLIGGHVT